ncbi:BglG family transcription antiterminator [Vagococcus penaei]
MTENEKKLLWLLSRQNSYQPAKFFSQEMGYSSKTIYQICDSLAKKLVTVYQEELIVRYPRHGIKLNDPNNHLVDHLKDVISEETKYSKEFREIYLLLELLINGKIAKISDYADIFYVTEITIQKDNARVVRLLEKNGIHMSKQGHIDFADKIDGQDKLAMVVKKIILDRAEKNVLVFDNYFKLYSEVKNENYYYSLFLSIQEFCEKNYINHAATLQNHHLNSLILSIYFYLLSQSRLEYFNSKCILNFSATQLEQIEWYVYVLEFSRLLKNKYDLETSQQDVQKICHLLVMHGFEFTNTFLETTNQQIELLVEELIANMSTYLDIDLRKHDKLKKSLIKHITPMVKRLQNNVYIKNPIVNQIKKQYSSVFQLVSIAVSHLEKAFGIILNEDENAFLTIHFEAAIESEIDAKHVYIVCKQGLLTSELIYNKLNQVLPKHTIIELITADQLNHLEHEKIDLVVSSVKIENSNYPICYVSILPSDTEIKHVVQTLFDIEVKRMKFTQMNTLKESILSRFVNQDHVFLKQNLKTKEEVFKFLATTFSQKELSYSDISSELNKRELLGYTSLNTGIAIPHVPPYLVKVSTVMFITLKKPISWGYNKVSLILFLAIKEEDVFYAKNIIEEIQEVIESSKQIETISASSSFEEFKKKLLRERKNASV